MRGQGPGQEVNRKFATQILPSSARLLNGWPDCEVSEKSGTAP
jgi:hypothetical protein